MRSSGSIFGCVVLILLAGCGGTDPATAPPPKEILLSSVEPNVYKKIDAPEGIAAVLGWIERHAQGAPAEALGAGQPRATLLLAPDGLSMMRRNNRDRRILLYGAGDGADSGAISAEAFQELYGYFEKWGQDCRQTGSTGTLPPLPPPQRPENP